MRDYAEFAEFTPMQLKKYFSSYFIFIYFLYNNCGTFETATNSNLLRKKYSYFSKKIKKKCIVFYL